jgi:hypothetical protein
MEQCKQKAEQIYRSMNSYANPKQMNGIDKDWIVECIARGLQEAATQSPSTTQGAVWLKGMPVVAGTYHVNYKSTLKGTTFFDPNSDTSVKYWEREVESYLDETGSQRQAGPVWVKAKIRLPEPGVELNCKWKGSPYALTLMPDGYFEGEGKRFSPAYVEWLDESQSTPSKESEEHDALKWVFENRRSISHVESVDQLNELYQRFSDLATFIPPSKEGDAVEQDLKDGKELTEHYRHIEQSEQMAAVGFAEWIILKGYAPCAKDNKWIGEWPDSITTEQLHNLYQQSK